ALDPPQPALNHLIHHGIEFKFSIHVWATDITGDISFDLNYSNLIFTLIKFPRIVCNKMEKIKNPIAILDLALTTDQIFDQIPMKDHNMMTSSAMRCYRRQIAATLSRRLNLPLIVFSSIADCPGALIAAKSEENLTEEELSNQFGFGVINPKDRIEERIFQFTPSDEIFSRFVFDYFGPNPDDWLGIAIFYDNVTGEQRIFAI
ncbi:hypothetical protein Ciccas_010923, partial [Cichlidogyrus casuarinus]